MIEREHLAARGLLHSGLAARSLLYGGRGPVERVVDDYVHGRIEVDELEDRIAEVLVPQPPPVKTEWLE